MNTVEIALSGLKAASKKIDASASNIANVQTAGSITGNGQTPYAALTTVQNAQSDQNGNSLGVSSSIVQKNNPFSAAYSPDSPFADENGFIGVPNVDLTEEAVNLNIAEISYKANLGVLKTSQELEKEVLSIFDKKV